MKLPDLPFSKENTQYPLAFVFLPDAKNLIIGILE
jgi:hypothetical protein